MKDDSSVPISNLFDDSENELYKIIDRICKRIWWGFYKGLSLPNSLFLSSDDLSQETWFRTLKFDGEGSFEGFVKRTAYRLCLDDLKRRRHIRKSIDQTEEEDKTTQYIEDEHNTPDKILSDLQLKELKEKVREAYLQLTPEHKQCIALYYEGLTFKEMAERLGIPPETVYSRFRKALEILATELRSL